MSMEYGESPHYADVSLLPEPYPGIFTPLCQNPMGENYLVCQPSAIFGRRYAYIWSDIHASKLTSIIVQAGLHLVGAKFLCASSHPALSLGLERKEERLHVWTHE